jgi:hypothetical protein
MTGQPAFDEGTRATLAALADVLIPAGTKMPAASMAGVAGTWLDELLRSRPDLGSPLAALLRRLAGAEPGAAVEDLRSADSAAFDLLAEAVAGAYFLNPEVRRLVAYPGQHAYPIIATDPPDYEEDGLLASVKGRGTIYRPDPHEPSA